MIVKPLTKLLVNKPKIVFLVFTIITIIIGINAKNIYIQSDMSAYLPSDDPTMQLLNEILDEFQMGATIIIYIDQNDRVYDIRDPKVLTEMDEVIRMIDINPLDDGEDGVVSTRSISNYIKEENAKPPILGGLGGTGNFVIPTDEKLITRYIARDSVQQMKGTLFINTYKIAVILIQLSECYNYEEVLSRTKNAIANRGTTYTTMEITGSIAMQNAVQKYAMNNLMIIFPIAIILVSIVLLFFHRTFKGIIIAFIPPTFAVALTFGYLGIVQPQLSIISISVVALLMGLGVDYSIHLMNRFAEEHALEDKTKRMEKTLKYTGKAVLLSTVTTMIGFGSLTISSMPPIVTFGIACAIGILFCFISAIILVPCLVLILKFEKNGALHGWKKLAKFTINNRKRVVLVAIFFAVMSVIVLPYVTTDVNYMDMAPEGIPELDTLQRYSDTFGGGANFNALLVETEYQGLSYPETMDAIYNLEERIREFGIVVYSIADELKEINDILDRKIIINKLADFIDIEKIIHDRIAKVGAVDSDFSKTLIMVYIPIEKSMDEIEYIVNGINSITSTTQLPHNGRVSELTGYDAINVVINKKLVDEQTRSMIIALLLVLTALIVIFNSAIYGLLTMIPVGFVLIWEPGFLVAIDIPLSVITISIASIMIGIGIDYGVHITQRVREELAGGISKREAIQISIEKTGLSLVEAALTTVAGVISIYFINIPALQEFGLIVLIMTLLSCIAAALILPIFFNLKQVK